MISGGYGSSFAKFYCFLYILSCEWTFLAYNWKESNFSNSSFRYPLFSKKHVFPFHKPLPNNEKPNATRSVLQKLRFPPKRNIFKNKSDAYLSVSKKHLQRQESISNQGLLILVIQSRERILNFLWFLRVIKNLLEMLRLIWQGHQIRLERVWKLF